MNVTLPKISTATRRASYAQSIRDATAQIMAADPSVYIMGLGVPDPKGLFGSTVGLVDEFGPDRVLDMPTAENAMTGIAIGSAIGGMRPILTHQRIDFMLLSLDQIINNAAKWHYMFGGTQSVPLTIRLIIGRGWGQGAQHAQSLQSIFAHIPGLKVVMPARPADSAGLLLSAVQDDNPVIILEHRWLYNIEDHVPEVFEPVPIGKARIAREGTDYTIVTSSYWVLEALRAAEFLQTQGVSVEVIDLRSVRPIDWATIEASVRKTRHCLTVDGSWPICSLASEITAHVSEQCFDDLKRAPQRLTFPDTPTPTSWKLARSFYPRSFEIAKTLRPDIDASALELPKHLKGDQPDPSFTGPF